MAAHHIALEAFTYVSLKSFSAGLDAGVDGRPTADNASDDACCDWPGVTCDESAAEGAAGVIAVVGLALPNRTLRGQVSASLAGLAALRVLNLSGNALHGTLPAALLRIVPSRCWTSAPTRSPAPCARNLTAYDVSGNGFAGAVDAAALCAASPAVRVLRLSMNRLSGAFPAGFGQCRSLVELSLDGNDIDGVLPDDLFGVTSLQFLSLHTNSISGSLSPLLHNLSSLVRLDFSFKALSDTLARGNGAVKTGPTWWRPDAEAEAGCRGGGGGGGRMLWRRRLGGDRSGRKSLAASRLARGSRLASAWKPSRPLCSLRSSGSSDWVLEALMRAAFGAALPAPVPDPMDEPVREPHQRSP
ncbi:phytosulfokine receptor 1 [Sorghum bicolor]|uniref:phytosulfokine receptor 1 n=1 Tax=Sorghum bicolor TaxID=4558 RepID=UPI000B424B10|nr:phytosulfokine receptor 1 [Sorghum bicolor]|eukprot:XP_021308392.1 phytosulfokine receptor 1 [Sorghum bicolor]